MRTPRETEPEHRSPLSVMPLVEQNTPRCLVFRRVGSPGAGPTVCRYLSSTAYNKCIVGTARGTGTARETETWSQPRHEVIRLGQAPAVPVVGARSGIWPYRSNGTLHALIQSTLPPDFTRICKIHHLSPVPMLSLCPLEHLPASRSHGQRLARQGPRGNPSLCWATSPCLAAQCNVKHGIHTILYLE